MSSSHSSARPTPKWRSSLSNKRHRPPPSVSLVFAQPEQGAKLASAIDKLPATVLDDAASFMSQASRKRERTQSDASSLLSRADRQEEQSAEGQVVQPQTEDVSRKRSKLSLDVHADAFHAIDQATQVQAEDSPGSSANRVARTESPCTAPAPQESPTTKEEPKLDASAKADDNSSSSLPKINIPFPGSEPQKTIRAAKSSPARSSWFGFSRSKADETASSALEPSDNSAKAHVTESPSPISPQTSVTATLPQAIPANGASKPTGAMSYTPTQYSPPSQRLTSNATSISSVDEEVPRPRFTSLDNTVPVLTPQAIVESQVTKAADRKPSITSLNPTASRFTLKLPLLGRPKIPLEHAVAVAQADDIREPLRPADEAVAESSHASGTTPEALSQAANTEMAQGGSPPSASSPDIPEQPAVSQEASPTNDADHHADADATNTHEHRTSSWWDYLGWGGHHPEDHAKPSEPGKDDADRSVSAEAAQEPSTAPSQVASEAQPAEPPQSPHATAVPKPESTTDSAEKNAISPAVQQKANQDDKAAAKPASVFSAETVKSHGSAWYSPWAWYSSSPAPGSTSQADAGGPANEGQEAHKTESEIVKEQALARDQSAEAEGPDQVPASAGDTTPKGQQKDITPKATTSSPEPANPIESSLAEHKSGWMSFLMSRALTIKSITNESHDQKDDGMEVMEIDDEPQPSAAISIPTGNDAQRAAAASSPKSASPAPSSPQPPSTPKSPTGKTPAAPPPKEREPRKPDPAEPLTESDSIKRETTKNGPRSPSPTPSKASGTTPPSSARPNFVLPTWEDTFHSPPRSYAPPRSQGTKSKLTGALSYVTGALFSKDERAQGKGKGKARETSSVPPEFLTFGQELPKALDVVGEELNPYILNGGCRVVVIGVAGWSPGAVTRTLAGGLPSSSSKFVNMTAQALEQFAGEKGFKFKKITRMPLEGDGTIRKKVSRVYNHLVNNEEWMEDLHAADVIFVASHSQGAIISTHLIDRLIEDGHILTSRSVDVLAKSAAAIAAGGSSAVPTVQAQRVCLLALCGIHLGPLRYLKTSSLLQPYIQYVENAAARELFEFQDTESKLSKNYIGALRNVMDHGAKVVYIASLNDQVVPIYSGLFTAASHPRILRALYIDNDAYHSSDFLSNLLILLIRILNAGLSDRGLLAHLSEATAGTLSGVGHSTAYEELATYSLAVKYFFMSNDGTGSDAELVINPFNAVEEQNDYEIPWLLRDMIADTKVAHFFAREFAQLRDAFDDWQPKTTILREVKKKLQPITRLSPTQLTSNSISKL